MSDYPSFEMVRATIIDKQTKFLTVLGNDDPLVKIIRAHIYVEHLLIEFIDARICPKEAISDIRLQFHQRVKLAKNLGLDGDFCAALTVLGRVRNKFAHDLDAVISLKDADDLGAALGAHHAIATSSVLGAYNEALGRHIQSLDDLSPDDKITLYAVTLWAGLAVAVAGAKTQSAFERGETVAQS
jgi:hypothetical protein